MWKFKRRLKGSKKKNLLNLTIALITVLVVFITIGFSAFQSSLDIGTIAATFRINKDIRITKITLDNATNNAISNWQEYNVSSISTNIDLPSSNSTITYEVEITNLGNIEMGILDISGLPSNLDYEISNYTLKDMLCDRLDDHQCKLGSVSKVLITLKYKTFDSSNTNYNVKLDFDFRRFYTISYINVDSAGLPNKIIEGDSINIQLNSPHPNEVFISGATGNYNATTGVVSISDVIDDVVISNTLRSYFIAYNGVDNLLFNQFDSTTIKSFERNTTKSISEIHNMVNNNTAYVISTSASDENYPSSTPVYGWVENNKFYWYSEANVVYYHPDTLGAFRLMSALITVNLNGTNSSLVKNFSHWFDKDTKLTTITGKINTSGLEYDVNPTFDFANDNNENASSEKGLAFMFNDCKALTAIDTSEIDTTNASDLKRMFGGCNSLRSIDVSHFNTSNAKSMYWMFRKNDKLTELDLRSFDTSNVENMLGMFVSDASITTIYLGENFDTSKVKKFDYMFYSMSKLTTIYAYQDFDDTAHSSSSNMFSGDTKLVGSANTLDETTYNSQKVNITYAKLAKDGVKGYFTPLEVVEEYQITYDLDGGTADNPSSYFSNSQTITLENPTKEGYRFIGWTGDNGNEPQMTVTIAAGSTGDKHFVAHFEEIVVDLFPKVFAISGSCNFNGSTTNITGDTCVSDLDGTNYTNNTYIDTGIALYSSENLTQDFEISFDISNYNPLNQETMANGNKQNTIMNSKAESSGYPGIVFRRSGDKLEIKSFNTSKSMTYNQVTSIKIARINKKIYYSFNGEAYAQLTNDTSFNSPFDLTLMFGASKDGSGQVFRHAKCTLSNIYVKLGTYT